MEYKTPDELLEFVLTECGGMKFSFVEQKGGNIKLFINKGFNMERIFYVYKLLIEIFNIKIHYLSFVENREVEYREIGDYLQQMEIKRFASYDNDTIGCPKLNDSVDDIYFDSDVVVVFKDENSRLSSGRLSAVVYSEVPNKNNTVLQITDEDNILNEIYIIDDKYMSLERGGDKLYFNSRSDVDAIANFLSDIFSAEKVKKICDRFYPFVYSDL